MSALYQSPFVISKSRPGLGGPCLGWEKGALTLQWESHLTALLVDTSANTYSNENMDSPLDLAFPLLGLWLFLVVVKYT